MQIKWQKSEGTQEAKPLEVESCKTCVFLRKDIRQVTVQGSIDEETHTVWQYQEAILSHLEYNQYVDEMNSPSFKEIMMMLNDIQADIAML